MLNACRKEKAKVKVVYQDCSFLVLNKPAGWVTLRVKTNKGETLQDWLEDNYQIFVAKRAGIVHRLDKQTWGLVLVARNENSFKNLQSQFKLRRVEKVYWALVRGELFGDGEIQVPVGRLAGSSFKFGVVLGGKQAGTKYRVIRNLRIDGEKYTLLRVEPKTGRTHQIRVHLKYLGHPIYGDSIYGGKKEKGRIMFLVAKKIGFFHPASGRKVIFKINLPKQLASLAGRG